MEKLSQLVDILKVLKYQHELTVDLNEDMLKLENKDDYNCNKVFHTKNSLEKVIMALADVKMFTVLREFLDHTDRERMSAEEDRATLKYQSDALRLEFHFLSNKLKENQEEISGLEMENKRLKSNLKLHNVGRASQSTTDDISIIISPKSLVGHIQSLFKFDINSDKTKRFRDNSDEVVVPLKLKTLYDLVMQYCIKGNYSVAIPLCEQSLVDIVKSSTKYSNDYASMLHVLANVYRDMGDYQKSVYLMLEVLLIRENLPDYSKTKVVLTLNCISVLYGLMYCWHEAGAYCQRGIALMREVGTSDDVCIAKQLESMAMICKNDNKMEKAIQCLKEASSIYRTSNEVYELDIRRVQSQMASCYLSLYEFDTALNLYQEIMDNGYQGQFSAIWGINKPLWSIAEEQECRLTSNAYEVRSNYADFRTLDGFDEIGLRDILSNMAMIYRQMGMNKAAKYLETWPDRNIPVPNIGNRICRSRSSMNVNDDPDIEYIEKRPSRHSSCRGSLTYVSPIIKALKTKDIVRSRDYLSKRSSVCGSRKFVEADVTIFESWSTPLVVKRQE